MARCGPSGPGLAGRQVTFVAMVPTEAFKPLAVVSVGDQDLTVADLVGTGPGLLHDPLTGLPNRLLFEDRLEHALAHLDRRHESVGVFYIDLDELKVVNDTHGHERGDDLLAEIGRRLSGVVRTSDTVARVGGDEFVVLAEGLSGRDDVAGIAQRILAVVAAPARLAEADVVPSVSVGVALACERDRPPALLLSEADAAMYRAKDQGKGCYEISDGRPADPELCLNVGLQAEGNTCCYLG